MPNSYFPSGTRIILWVLLWSNTTVIDSRTVILDFLRLPDKKLLEVWKQCTGVCILDSGGTSGGLQHILIDLDLCYSDKKIKNIGSGMLEWKPCNDYHIVKSENWMIQKPFRLLKRHWKWNAEILVHPTMIGTDYLWVYWNGTNELTVRESLFRSQTNILQTKSTNWIYPIYLKMDRKAMLLCKTAVYWLLSLKAMNVSLFVTFR